MILTDYFKSPKDITWDYAKQCGVSHGVIRLPETEAFDVCNVAHWQQLKKSFTDFGITPLVVEPLPNCLHDHIKAGDEKRDACIEKCIKMLEIMDETEIRTLCFNFMAYVGWTRTDNDIKERGNALVTGFDLHKYQPSSDCISEQEMWDNYTYFIKAVLPHAEKHGIKLALHPDDPPLAKLGDVSRIMISYENIKKAMEIGNSPNLGVTMCQATYLMMGEDLYDIIPKLRDKIFFIHFRNTTGNKNCFRETFHDNGEIEMGKILKLYQSLGINVPIRVDHVPAMAGETDGDGYTALGRLYAIGYLKGLLEGLEA